MMMNWPANSLMTIASDETIRWGLIDRALSNRPRFFGPFGADGPLPINEEKHVIDLPARLDIHGTRVLDIRSFWNTRV